MGCNLDISEIVWFNWEGVCDDGECCIWQDLCAVGSCVGTFYTCEFMLCASLSCDGVGGCTKMLVSGFCEIDGICFQVEEISFVNQCVVCFLVVIFFVWLLFDGFCDDGDVCMVVD